MFIHVYTYIITFNVYIYIYNLFFIYSYISINNFKCSKLIILLYPPLYINNLFVFDPFNCFLSIFYISNKLQKRYLKKLVGRVLYL